MDISQLLSALEASPDNIPLILMVAQAYEDEFELEKANELIEQGLGFEPENEALILKKIHLLDLEGKTSEAVIRLEVLLGQAANNAQAHMLMARLLFKEENPKEAFKHYQRAVGIDNNLRDDELLGEITKAGGAVGGAVRSDGSFDFDLDDDEDIPFEDLEGIDAMKAHDLGLEYEAISDIDFSGVGGMTDVKEDIQMKIIFPLENPELYKSYGKKAGGGVLMYGPPGCGKTLLSRATAGEIKSGFFSIGLHQIFDMYIGQSEKNLNQIFELCRNKQPCILFFDEIDALAADRRDFKTSSSRTLINQFLAEMDGSQSDNEGVLVLGATNAPWHVDSAFLRPGRFDRVVFVPPPDLEARIEIIKIMAENKPLVKFNPEDLAAKTEGFSGADLSAVFDQATEHALKEAMKAGGKVVPLSGKTLLKIAKTVKPSTKKWFESAKNYALYANQSGLYDDILEYLNIKK